MSPPPNPHDALFRLVFGDPAHPAGELRAMLPVVLVARMNFATLRLVSGSFVDEALAGSQSDVLFEVEVGGRPALVYVLLEHQSKSDRWMAFRVLRYEVRIWDAFLAEHPDAKRLPPIVPIVVAHAEGGWQAATQFERLVDLEGVLRTLAPHVPRFRYLLDDLSRVPDAELAVREASPRARVVLRGLKHARSDLLDALDRVSDLLQEIDRAPGGPPFIGVLMRYTLLVGLDSVGRSHGRFR